jgi:cyclopropane fatty-acyl-phospholipid synthase-like methyltransferase
MQTPKRQISAALDLLAREGAGKSFCDLGSGDGAAVIAAAQRGYKAHGIELNPALLLWSKLQARRAGVHATATFEGGNMFEHNLSRYDSVMCFGVAPLMPRLAAKVRAEAQDGTRIVLYRFQFPEDWPVLEQEGSVRLYRHTTAAAQQQQKQHTIGAGSAIAASSSSKV